MPVTAYSGSFIAEFRLKILLFGSLLSICLIGQANDNVIGCYAVSIMKSEKLSLQLKSLEHLTRLKDIRLTSEHARTPWKADSAFRVVPAVTSDRFDYAAAYWELEKGKLSITWTNTGLSGVEMNLRSTAGGFEGTIEQFWDFEPFVTDKRRVILTRRPC